ncbi:MAG: DASS family sodium-coupled anion symporter [Maricaulaceae bacterium]
MQQSDTGDTGVPVGAVRVRHFGLIAGLVVAFGLQLLPLPDRLIEITGGEAEARQAWIVLSLISLMAIWWVTEAIAISATALLPLIILPLFGIMTVGQLGGSYMATTIVLLMGGMMFAKAIERWNLHERIALNVISRVGVSPGMLILGFMIATAAISMWISNTATSVMMVPIALSVSHAVVGRDVKGASFTIALLLGVCFAANIGGLGTLVGSPTNLIVQEQLRIFTEREITFTSWMLIGVPTVLILIPLAWIVLAKVAFRLQAGDSNAAKEAVAARMKEIGPITVPEQRTLMIFATIASLWVFGEILRDITIAGVTPLAGLSDASIAIVAVALVFLVPAGGGNPKGTAVLDWKSAEAIPWGALLLFGGGLAMAAAIRQTMLGEWIGEEFHFITSFHPIIVIGVVTALVCFTTEVTSNTSTASTMMPIFMSVAIATGQDPIYLAAAIGMAASCAFMLPMATGPNAIVFASGEFSIATMARTGLIMNVIAIAILTGIVYWLAPMLAPALG